MSVLKIYPDTASEPAEIIKEHSKIAKILNGCGIGFEAWEAAQKLSEVASNEEILAAYDGQVNELKQKHNFQAADVVSLNPDHPQKDEMRQKFLAEHTHTDDEIRFFVDGSGLFYLHLDNIIYGLLCQKNDLISIPANTLHWFDMGSKPFFKCIRLFTDPAGWVGHFTGSDIARRFPTYDDYVGDYE